jgi:hypothetical protein
VTHVPDIAVVWFGWDLELGSGIYGLPLAALAVESIYGLAIWHYVRGGLGLLVAIVVFQLATLSAHVAWLSGPEAHLAANPAWLATGIAIQIAVTLPLVWWLSRRSPASHRSATTPSIA